MARNRLIEIIFTIAPMTPIAIGILFSQGTGGGAPKLRKVTFQSRYTCAKIFKSWKLKHNDGCTAICFGVGATRHDLEKNDHVVVVDQ